MRAKFYDGILLGDSLAGLVAGALLAERKYRLIWLRQVRLPESDLHIGDRGAGAKRLVYPNVFDRPVPAAVIRELNIGHKLRSAFKPLSPLYQVVEGDRRFTFHSDPERLGRELEREYPQGGAAEGVPRLSELLKQAGGALDRLLVPGLPAHPMGITEGWDLSKRLKELKDFFRGSNESLSELDRRLDELRLGGTAEKLLPVVVETTDEKESPFRYRAFGALFFDLLSQIAEVGLEEILIERMERHNGRIVDSVDLLEAEITRDGFKFRDAKNTYGAESLIAACDPFLLSEIFPVKKAMRYADTAMSRLKPVKVWTRLGLVVKKPVIPEGMEARVFLMPEKTGEPLLLLTYDPVLPDDAETLVLNVDFPVDVADFNPTRIQPITERVLERLRTLIPFLSDHLVQVHPDAIPLPVARNEWLPLAGRRLVYESLTKGFFKGLSYELPFSNAWLAHTSVFPEFGLEGEFINGWNVARWICKKHPKKDELGSKA